MLDSATLLGGLGAILVLVVSLILGGSNANYLDWPSVLIVVVGSPLIVLTKFSASDFFSAWRNARFAFFRPELHPAELIQEMAQLAEKARKNGLLGLENAGVSDDYLRSGIAFMVDGHDADVVRALLQKESALMATRLDRSVQVFRALADVAPALGMIGTLVGLVAMLGNLSDPSALGPAMAVALLTTLYGALIAHVLALPLADKLQSIRDQQRQWHTLIIDGLQGIQAGHNPRLISNMLQSYLPPHLRALKTK